jgi:N-acetylglucosamine-6-phosphate deacetylase
MSDIITGRSVGSGEGVAVRVDSGIIAEITSTSEAADHFLSPGLIDIQINGFAGFDLNSGRLTPQTVSQLCQKLLSLGVTTFLPTVITASEASITQALQAIAVARRIDDVAAQMITGVHVEGPSIGPEDGPRGAHPIQHVRAPSLDEFKRWQAASGDLVTMVTLSPHYAETVDYVAALTAMGVAVAIGHTGASADQVRAAVKAGAVLSTHLGNGSAAIMQRHPNFLWAQLAADELTASFIADGFHLPSDALTAMIRAKGLERSVLVSDAVALGGMPAGRYGNPIGGVVEVSAEGRIGVADTPYLAGAGFPLPVNVALATQLAQLSLSEAIMLATRNPGRFCEHRGKLEIGARADLITFGFEPGARELDIQTTYLGGALVYSK